MTDTATSLATDGKSATVAAENQTDDVDAQLEAMRLAEEETTPEPQEPKEQAKAKPEAEPDEKQKAEAETEENEKPPLTPEEVEKRWRDTQGALKAERGKRQERDRELEELRAEIETLKGGRPSQAQQETADDLGLGEAPDMEKDPMAYLKWTKQVVDAMMQERRQTASEQQQESEQSNYVRQVVQTFTQAENEYRKAVPDYDDAMEHLRQARIAEIEAFGIPKAQAVQQFQQEALQMADAAYRTGNQPAAVVYKIAQTRGYRPKAAEETKADPVQDRQKADAEMQKRRDAEKLSKSLGGGGGKAAKSGPSIELANATKDGDEFDRLFEQLRDEAGY